MVLINAAISDKLDIAGMSMPKFPTGLTNYYEARLTSSSENVLTVLTLSLDSFGINQAVALVKIDVEGHESFVLAGMQKLIEKHHPVLIVETNSREVISKLSSMGYVSDKLPGSPNVLLKPKI